MFNTFGSSIWMLPFSKYCTTDNVYRRHFSGGNRKNHHAYHCDEHEHRSDYSGWPTNIINIEVPSIRGITKKPTTCCIFSITSANGLLICLSREWGLSIICRNCPNQLVWNGMWIPNAIVLFCSWSLWWNLFQSHKGLWSWQWKALAPSKKVSITANPFMPCNIFR